MKLRSDNTLIWVVLIFVAVHGCKTREGLRDHTHRESTGKAVWSGF
ncbi:hypothetical protein DSS3P1_67 [Ruegeria phage DSS3-P1]|nr:hypothetical protein DSS3P1_67 [Ruegeria phage DSS3-P1]YP_009997284.1 hypothetical protein JT312_gp67 [Ruegeria phage vB_RpoS-V18]YP_009997366.1 hypothetical protein JT313_gp67 [Ruegeria phage vB_RpoS-V11]YP_009997450.1 hypothetical protein JT314_gp69 [Ruegeria phage vB_RpoS-V7]AIT13302.1 hypothetical protein DSS3P1_67 [Ruegeria phage DSS3-P1]AWY08772.1 hypothetical protein vBRpoSV7_69 [Ruegeria phage vB_RpoS-V7]AWY08943.1 hypothetical protein vBRpoSV18_67 [Ruegeria phage vB_RpoS-V18]AWY0